MQSSLNILWQKKKNCDEYMDIFAINGHKMNVKEHENTVNLTFQSRSNSRNNAVANQAHELSKKSYGEKKYMKAMNLINDSLRSAEIGSVEVAYAFATRSACFLRMNMPEECLMDIELAKQSNYPANMIQDLETRKNKCINMLVDDKFKEDRFTPFKPKLSFDEHKNFAGVADCLEIRKNTDYGRHVIAMSDLKIGQTILVEEPFAIIKQKSSKIAREYCARCFKEYKNFIMCKNCISSNYCNETCMEKSFHKYECGMSESLCKNETLQHKFELVLKMFYNINAAFPNIDTLITAVDLLLKNKIPTELANQMQKQFCSLFQLTHNHRMKSDEQLNDLLNSTSIAFIKIMHFPEFKQKFATLKEQRFLQHLILHLFHIVEHAVDLIEWSTLEGDETPMSMTNYEHMASGMFPFGCYLNHSCVRMFAGFLLATASSAKSFALSKKVNRCFDLICKFIIFR